MTKRVRAGERVDRLDRHNRPIRHEGDILARAFAPRQNELPAPLVTIDAEPFVCVIINREWLSHVLGVLDTLAQTDAWVGDELEKQRAVDQINTLIEMMMIGDNCMFDPCCPDEIEQNSTIIYNQVMSQVQNNIANNYQMSVVNQWQYDGTPQSIAPNLGANFSDGTKSTEDALCLALKRFMENIIMQEVANAAIVAGVGAAAIAAAIALAPLTFGLSVVAGFIAASAAVIGWERYNAMINDDEAQKKAICCIFDYFKGLTITQENFAEVVTACAEFDPFSPEALIVQLISNAGQSEGNYLAFLRILGECQGKGDRNDCDCCDNILDYDIVEDTGATVTRLSDFQWQITQTNYTVAANPDPFCGDVPRHIFVMKFHEIEDRCIDIIAAVQPGQASWEQLTCDGILQSGVGGGGGIGKYFTWVWTPCPSDPNAEETTTIITIACPPQTFKP